MKAVSIKTSILKLAAAGAIALSAAMSPLTIAAESGVVSDGKNEFRGEDMCIAILDRGFSFDHESLIITDKTPKLSKRESDRRFKNTVAYEALSEKTGEVRQKLFKKEKSLSVYLNEKIPFAYDYGDNDTDLSGIYSAHGMAMISIAAGTDTLYGGTSAIPGGTAPEAQIFAMKVYSDLTGEVSEAAMSAAVNDAVTMGADVIYIAVTEICGFEETGLYDFEAALDNAKENGVIVVSAAGDVLAYGTGNIYDRVGSLYSITTDSPDVGMVAYPSSSPDVISVGSADRYEIISDFLTLGDGQEIPYSDSNFMYEIGGVKKSFAQHFEKKELEYVICDGVGKPEELAAAGDLRGKAAVIKRGEITFAQKAQNAAALGAACVVIYDDEFTYSALETMMALEDAPIPAIFILCEDLEKLTSAEKMTFTTNVGASYSTAVNESPFVSVFSPSGTTPHLGLKPDVLAVGTSVRCAVSDDGYGTMSSTTASAAKVAGISAAIKEYLLDSGEKFTKIALAERVKSLLVNSASVLDNMATKELYSPRKQGGGLASLENAVSTELLLSCDGNFKAELGDGHSAVIEFEICAENLSASEKACTVDCTVGTDGYTTVAYEDFLSAATESILGGNRFEDTDGKINFITYYKALKGVDTYIDGVLFKINTEAEDYQPYTFTLGALESRTFKVKLVIDDETYDAYSEIFENGFFAEGFISLRCEDEAASVPFLAFCGDFGKAHSIDAEIYGDGPAVFDSCYLYYDSSEGGSGISILGEIDVDGEIEYDKSSMAFSPKVNPYSSIGLNLGLKRSLSELTVTVTDEGGEVIIEHEMKSVSRSYVSATTGSMVTPNFIIWNGRAPDNHGYIYGDGAYDITVTYRRVAEEEEKSFTYRIFIDSTPPKIEVNGFEVRDGREYMTITAEENHAIASVEVFDSRFRLADVASDLSVDISGLTGEFIYIEASDSAGNKSVVRINNPNYR